MITKEYGPKKRKIDIMPQKNEDGHNAQKGKIDNGGWVANLV